MALSHKERVLRSRMAAHALHSQRDSRELTAPGRAKFLQKFEDEVDPDGVLDPSERARRAEHRRKQYFLGLAYKSAKARRARANGSRS